MLLFDIEKVCRTKIFTKKLNVSFPASILTGDHTTQVIFTVKICIFEQSNEKKIISRKLKYIFAKKTTPQLLGHIGL